MMKTRRLGPYGSRGPFTCRHCSAHFFTHRPPGEGEQFCSRNCSYASKAAPPKFSVVRESQCKQCGKVWIARRKGDFCCDTCVRSWRAQKARESAKAKKNVSSRPCAECGNSFVPGYGDKHRVFCGKACASAHNDRARLAKLKEPAIKAHHSKLRKRRLRGGQVDPVQVFERDGWRCGICGEPVDRCAAVPNHNAPTVDHVVPLSAGGPHAFANVQCAHFICNVKKASSLPRG